ncbi:MAG: AMP-binding protein, partial [Caldanaerobacter sp.]
MMEYPLTIRSILYRAKTIFPRKEVVSRDFSGIFRYTYGDMYKRVCKLAHVLKKMGIQQGDRVASFAWNNHRHLELYFAVPCYGAVLNTVNIRLFRDHLIHCINFAENKVMFIDEDLVPVIEDIQGELHTVQAYVIMTDKAVLPRTTLYPVYSYEELIKNEPDEYDFPYLDEWSPAIMAYTTATTGFPKGVVYTHRGLYVHTLSILVGEYAARERDVCMPIVPMFHVN